MRKKTFSTIILISIVFGTSFLLSINMTLGLTHSTIYGFVKNSDGDYLQGVEVKAYIGSTLEDSDTTEEDGSYEVDLGLIWSTTSVTLKFYPLKNHKDKIISTTIGRAQIKRKDATLTQFFALIIGGASEVRFTTDAQLMHNVLTNYYSFDWDGDNIYMLTVGSTADQDKSTSKTNLAWAVDQIADRSSSIDQVYVWITSHGYEGDSKMVFGSEDLTANDLDTELDQITSQVMYIFLGQCFSESFRPYLDDEQNRAIYTSCTSSEPAYCTGDYLHSLWPWAITKALNGLDQAPNADVNSDHRVSLYELHTWCYNYIINYFPPEHPDYNKQHPKRWVGSIINPDTNDFIGDETYI